METTFKQMAKKFSWKRFAFRSAVKNMQDESRTKEFQEAVMPEITLEQGHCDYCDEVDDNLQRIGSNWLCDNCLR